MVPVEQASPVLTMILSDDIFIIARHWLARQSIVRTGLAFYITVSCLPCCYGGESLLVLSVSSFAFFGQVFLQVAEEQLQGLCRSV